MWVATRRALPSSIARGVRLWPNRGSEQIQKCTTGRPSLAPGREEEAHVLVSQGAGSGGGHGGGAQPAAEAGTVKVGMTVNGKAAAADVDPRTLLVQFLRENLRLTGTHVGCDTSQCGACVVHLDGRAVKSCTVLAASCDGASVTTIEGLARDGKLHPMQEAFRQHHGLQCGFCTPGMIMAAVDLANTQGRQPRRAHRARGAGRQPVPLHGLSQHRRRRAGPAPPPWAACARPPNSSAAEACSFAGPDATEQERSRSNAMADTGIGASVKRKEDQRFITGKGQYTDDINRPGQTWAVFVRSPHAHANIKKHRRVGGAEVAGLPGRLHRRRHRRRQGRAA